MTGRSKLTEAHQALVRAARPLVKKAEAVNDVATADLVTQRIQIREKTAWMLRSLAG